MHSAFAIINRPDTFLGVCEGIGTDLGINPNWLRLAWAAPLLLNPVLTAVAYVALAALVVASRWLIPSRPDVVAAEPVAATQAPIEANDRADDYALAA